MAAAIHTLTTLSGAHRSILVLGDMLELGNDADRLHGDIGALAGRTGITRLYATGPHAEWVAQGARSEGMAAEDVMTGAKDAIIEALKKELKAGDRLLVKGSRGSAMEAVLEPIKQWASRPEEEAQTQDCRTGDCRTGDCRTGQSFS